MSNTTIYVLRLEGEKYYVGKSDNVLNRFRQHFDGTASAWTKKHKPISLDKLIADVSPFEEDKITKEYMHKFGIDNVRGGSYVEVELGDARVKAIQVETWAAMNLCTRCGRSNHFVKSCYAKTDSSGTALEITNSTPEKESAPRWDCPHCDKTFATENNSNIHAKSCKKSNDACSRCGYRGHDVSECYANIRADGGRAGAFRRKN